MISSASSQQRLTDSTVIVPIKSLKNALLVKVERDNLKKELVISRDSIKAMDTIIFRKDIIISVLDSLIAIDKAKLADVAEKAKQYKNQYEKERNRINNMSDDDIISEFTAAFK